MRCPLRQCTAPGQGACCCAIGAPRPRHRRRRPARGIEALRETIGYVSQSCASSPRGDARHRRRAMIARGTPPGEGLARATALLHRLNLPERRHGCAGDLLGRRAAAGEPCPRLRAGYPVLLRTNPRPAWTRNRAIVNDLMREAKAAGSAIIAIFHDADLREARGPRLFERAPAAGRRMTETILTNAILSFRRRPSGTLVVRDGRIARSSRAAAMPLGTRLGRRPPHPRPWWMSIPKPRTPGAAPANRRGRRSREIAHDRNAPRRRDHGVRRAGASRISASTGARPDLPRRRGGSRPLADTG